MKSNSYSELLKDPRWQKKRLDILNRDNFTCQICGHQDKPLHVHHISYKRYIKPWEYDNNNLITLCEDCHHEEHNSKSNIIDYINSLQEKGVLMIEIESIFEHIELSLGPFNNPNVILDMIGGPTSTDKEEKQDWWGLDCPPDLCERIVEWRKKVNRKDGR